MKLEVRSPFKFNQRVYRKAGELVDVPEGMQAKAERLLRSGAANIVLRGVQALSTDTTPPTNGAEGLSEDAGAAGSPAAPADSAQLVDAPPADPETNSLPPSGDNAKPAKPAKSAPATAKSKPRSKS